MLVSLVIAPRKAPLPPQKPRKRTSPSQSLRCQRTPTSTKASFTKSPVKSVNDPRASTLKHKTPGHSHSGAEITSMYSSIKSTMSSRTFMIRSVLITSLVITVASGRLPNDPSLSDRRSRSSFPPEIPSPASPEAFELGRNSSFFSSSPKRQLKALRRYPLFLP
jgi:hypothetical protein